jgi:hypothetical protein
VLFLAPLHLNAAVTVPVNGTNYTIPQTNEKGWGANVTAWIQAISGSTLQKNGGTFSLTGEVDLGANYGLISTQFKSRSSNVASTGILRLARPDGIYWRNEANSANLGLTVNSSNELLFNGVKLVDQNNLDASAITSLTGDVTASGPGAATTTLATVNSNTGSFGSASNAVSFTVNGKGLVTAASSTPIEIAQSQVTNLVSDLSAKAPIASPAFTGTIGTPLSASRVLVTDSSSNLSASSVTSTTLGYLDIGSSLTSLLAAKAPLASPTFTGTVTLPANTSLTTPLIDVLSLTEQSTTPDTPSAGTKKLYAKNNGKLYTLDSDNYEKQVGSGSGGGSGKNYTADIYDGSSATGITMYCDAASTSPVDGTGGTTTGLGVGTASNVLRASNIRFSKASSNKQGCGWAYAIKIDKADRDGAKPFSMSFTTQQSANYASGDVKWFLINVDTGAVTAMKAFGQTDGTMAASTSQSQTFYATFTPTSADDDYLLVAHIATTNALAYDIDIVDWKTGIDPPSAAAIGEYLGTETWADNWANATVSVNLYRDGNRIYADGTVSVTGTPTSTGLVVTIPSTYAPKSDYYSGSKLTEVGSGFGIVATSGYGFASIISSATALEIHPVIASGTYRQYVDTTTSIPAVWTNGNYIKFNANWQVEGWLASNFMSSAALNAQNESFSAYKNGNQTISSTSATKITSWTVTKDIFGAWSAANNRYVVKRTGRYTVSVGFQLTNNTSEPYVVNVYVNGSLAKASIRTFGSGDSASISAPLDLNVNDYVEVFVNSTTDTSYDVVGSAVSSWFSVTASPDFTVYGAYSNVSSNYNGQLKTESARVAGASETTVCGSSPCTLYRNEGSWLTNCTRASTGTYTCNYTGFSAAPKCFFTTSGATGWTSANIQTVSSSAITFQTGYYLSAADTYFDIFCMGPR